MKKNKLVAPVLKWVGGKRQLIETFSPLLPKKITSYCEPFVGGGALLFHLQPNIAYVNDINTDKTVDRTIATNNPLRNAKLWHDAGYNQIPSIKQMIEDIN